ncbi:uncharacterized protein LTHEOB_4383 [Lasiodiplodia theobromae]|uniref:uncharacterized protein n=1 Tax=Lasiodiplodia theobromae TaxID=45133 RepID=UPI0015C39291|nr:uncharacterized protein LTHEOB_4383 [Lasiodiplodia theobromae]KAF4546386.1 hypothetical protein LTHEOB_4383 [Lasiodiplodia theobromae]
MSPTTKNTNIISTEAPDEPLTDDESSNSHVDTDSAGDITADVLKRRRLQKAQPWKASYRPHEADMPKTSSILDVPWYNIDTTPEAYDTNSGS